MSTRFDLGPKPLLGYTATAIDRAANRRDDTVFLAAARQAAETGSYLVGGERVVLRKDGDALDPLFPPASLAELGADGEHVFLGLAAGEARFGVPLPPAVIDSLALREDLHVTDLRTIAVQGLAAPEHLGALAEAKAILQWHARHRFCANCGAPTTVVQGGWRRDCPSCNVQHFPRTDPVVIMLAVDGERCLLGRQSRFAPGVWSCLAGFVEPGETIEEAVRREVVEEAGVICGRVAYFASQPWPFPMSLMIGCHAEAKTTELRVDYAELEDARWFDRAEVASMLARTHPDGLITPPPMAIAHHIIRAWVTGDGFAHA
jgi:NAD+ diphosphatase